MNGTMNRELRTDRAVKPFTNGQEVQINSACFIPEWIGMYGTVVTVTGYTPEVGWEVIIKAEDGRLLTLYATSLSPTL